MAKITEVKSDYRGGNKPPSRIRIQPPKKRIKHQPSNKGFA